MKNASTTGPRRASVQLLSARGSVTEQAGRAPASPWLAYLAMFASPARSLVTSGAANGGRCVPRSSPLELVAGVESVL